MSKSPTIPPFVNQTMKFILRSPVHGMISKDKLLITFIGRKSGKNYTTPVSYSQSDGHVTIFTHAGWWKNLQGGKPVSLRLRGKDVQGVALPVEEDKPAIAASLANHLQKVHSDAGFYGVSFNPRGEPRADEVEQAVKSVVMISVSLN